MIPPERSIRTRTASETESSMTVIEVYLSYLMRGDNHAAMMIYDAAENEKETTFSYLCTAVTVSGFHGRLNICVSAYLRS